MDKNQIVQGSLFEDDYLIRTLGPLANSAEIALTEIVANAWDAGATTVDIFIPEKAGDKMTITDNGTGLSKDEFYNRWMKLGYNRLKSQGKKVEFPPKVKGQRMAYGRNGVGRHGMLCFNNEYTVSTSKDGKESTFEITTSNKSEPFVIKAESFSNATKTGTVLEVIVTKNLPKQERILDVISTKFLHDPTFKVTVNRQTVPLEQLTGLIQTVPLEIGDVKLKIHVIDSKKTSKSTAYQGIAIWQSGRLIGEPSWLLGDRMVLDGRTKLAKRYTVVVETNDIAEYILEDWTGFRLSQVPPGFFEEIADTIIEIFKGIAKESIEETKAQIKSDYSKEYNELSPLAKYEFNEAIETLTVNNPTATADSVALAVQTILQLEKSRSGSELLVKLSSFSEEDVEGLNRLLDNWTVKDALTVLDEIDSRISVIEAIRKLSNDSSVDELHVLHPLITSARWVFGPEFDSPEYASNNQLQTTVEKVFGKKIDKSVFTNSKKRPDIVVMGDSTFSITGTEGIDNETGISYVNQVLIIELKRGGFKLTSTERNQAAGYIDEIQNCGRLINSPYINAFVVGETFATKMSPIQAIFNANNVEVGKVRVCLFSQIVDTAEKRLFGLRKRLNERYDDVPGMELYKQHTLQL